jgi:hypothetical protein
MVDLIGIEPMTSSMPWKRAPNCATGPLLGNSNKLIFADLRRFVKLPASSLLQHRSLSPLLSEILPFPALVPSGR